MTKYLLTFLVSVCVGLVILEISPYLVYPTVLGKNFDREAILKELRGYGEESQPSKSAAANVQRKFPNKSTIYPVQVLHPYFGFAGNPDKIGGYSEDGFYFDHNIKKNDDEFRILVLGGSFADGIFSYSSTVITKKLSTKLELKGKNINIVSAAFPGYKQPQQLLVLGYFLALGSKFDAVINIDGYNELVLPLIENHAAGVYPAFPRAWHIFGNSGASDSEALSFDQINSTNRKRNQYREVFSSEPLVFSNFCLAMWERLDHFARQEQLSITSNLVQNKGKEKLSFQETGPRIEFSLPQLFEELVSIWSSSTLQIYYLTHAQGIEYFHFLQPNQYVIQSKPLTDEEKRSAYIENVPRQEWINRGYQKMIEVGLLQAEISGLQFYDLSMIYQNEQDTLYVDNCCHVNRRGYDIAAEEIANIIADSLEIRAEELRPEMQ